MNPAKRLNKIGVWFKGPHTPELFKMLYIKEKYREFDHVAVGTGESRAVAAARALSHMRDLNVRPIMDDIQTHVQLQLPRHSNEIEAESGTNMYCIIGIEVDRD